MTPSIKKHLNVFKSTYHNLINSQDDFTIRKIILDLCLYLEKSFLLDKAYLKKYPIFLTCEANKVCIKDQSIDDLLTFLTIIYRIDYVDSNSDAFLMYYKNGMILSILDEIIHKMELL